jgi:ferredoxin
MIGSTAMRLVVNADRCQGHALCASVAPDLFELNDEDGHSTAVGGELDADQQPLARKASMACPEQAVRLKF